MDLPSEIPMQPMAPTDVGRVARFANAYSGRWTGRDMMTEQALRTMLGMPGMDLPSSTRLVLDPDDTLVGAAIVFDREPHVAVHAWGLVDEAHQGRGIGAALHRWILERCKRAVAQAPADARVIVRQQTFDGDAAAQAFLRGAGYTETRHYWRMLVAFRRPPATPTWPEGIAVDTIDPERDLEASIRASWDAFRDHYGFVPGSIDKEIERARHRIQTDPDFDPSLWFLARDGGEIAGLCFCSPKAAGDESTGYIGTLGVRPRWRRRGVARALLLHAFGAFHRRGTSRVALHVDAQSLTGATQLYESVGMRVDELSHEYERELRPGVDLPADGPPA